MEKSRWSESSDDDLVAILKAKAQDKSWTISEIFELEKRGFEILDKYPELRHELERIRDSQIEKILKSTKPALDTLRAQGNLAEDLIKALPKMEIPKMPSYQVPTFTLQGVTGPVGPKFGNSQILESAANNQLVQQGIAHTLKEILDTNVSTLEAMKKDPAFWMIFAFTGVSAVCSILSIVLVIIHY
jgi:hypothetical protein